VGAGFASDAFLVAFRLPNMFRALFAEGAFASAFVPMFNQKVTDPEGRGFRRASISPRRPSACCCPRWWR
jgi:putative peptidoglycan lipid II flippase